MTKWILAITMTLGAFTAGASTTSASTSSDDTTEVGTCSYTCTATDITYINRTQCRANCSSTCVVEAC